MVLLKMRLRFTRKPLPRSEIAVHTEKNTDDIKDLVNENTALTEQVKRATDLLEEIHRHVSALTPEAGRFPPGQDPRQSSP